jgi:hypothetical protein
MAKMSKTLIDSLRWPFDTIKEKIEKRLEEVEEKIERKKLKKVKISPGFKKELDFYQKGHVKPNCVNPGCSSDVAWRRAVYWSMRSECSPCMTARKEKRFIDEGGEKHIVNKKREKLGKTIHKKFYCENHDSQLGFKCPVNKDGWSGNLESLDLDHKDGNHLHNHPINVRTICKLCHGRNSREEKHWDSTKPSGMSLD